MGRYRILIAIFAFAILCALCVILPTQWDLRMASFFFGLFLARTLFKWTDKNLSHQGAVMFKIGVIALSLMLLTGIAAAQQYTPTKSQHAKLAKERAHIIAMQEKISDLQNQIAYEIEQATVTCKQIAAQNGWPVDVTCNLQTLSFAVPAPPTKEQDKKKSP